jgi:hypothetical protein
MHTAVMLRQCGHHGAQKAAKNRHVENDSDVQEKQSQTAPLDDTAQHTHGLQDAISDRLAGFYAAACYSAELAVCTGDYHNKVDYQGATWDPISVADGVEWVRRWGLHA